METPQSPDEASRAAPPPAAHLTGCVACGYNLFGLGDEPRCPECGLLNVPAEYRRQVWELVDSGKWFFSGFFHPFRKRPPGWWWSLDRPGDVGRSVRAAARNAAIAVTLCFVFGALVDAFPFDLVTRYAIVSADGTSVDCGNYSQIWSIAGSRRIHDGVDWRKAYPKGGPPPTQTSSVRILFEPSWRFVPLSSWILGVVVGLWIGPAMVGLVSQVRKGLPPFAQARRTILAAANLESHRLVYAAFVVVAWLSMSWFRAHVWSTPSYWLAENIFTLFCYGSFIFLVLGWVGPLRSDFTRQLVRSRFHAARIIVMYAILFPLALGEVLQRAVATIMELPLWE